MSLSSTDCKRLSIRAMSRWMLEVEVLMWVVSLTVIVKAVRRNTTPSMPKPPRLDVVSCAGVMVGWEGCEEGMWSVPPPWGGGVNCGGGHLGGGVLYGRGREGRDPQTAHVRSLPPPFPIYTPHPSEPVWA